jgi:hypothetical protein
MLLLQFVALRLVAGSLLLHGLRRMTPFRFALVFTPLFESART